MTFTCETCGAVRADAVVLPPEVLLLIVGDPQRAASIVSRAVQQEFAAAEPAYWRRRARTLAGVGTSWASGAATACSQHAVLLEAERRGVSVLDVLAESEAVAA